MADTPFGYVTLRVSSSTFDEIQREMDTGGYTWMFDPRYPDVLYIADQFVLIRKETPAARV